MVSSRILKAQETRTILLPGTSLPRNQYDNRYMGLACSLIGRKNYAFNESLYAFQGNIFPWITRQRPESCPCSARENPGNNVQKNRARITRNFPAGFRSIRYGTSRSVAVTRTPLQKNGSSVRPFNFNCTKPKNGIPMIFSMAYRIPKKKYSIEHKADDEAGQGRLIVLLQ